MSLQNELGKISLTAQSTISKSVWKQLQSFFLDGWTGNVTLSVKDGRILCLRVEEITNAPRPNGRP